MFALAASLLLVAGCGGSDEDSVENPPDASGSSADLLGPAAPAEGAPVKIGIITDGKTSFGDSTIHFDVADATAKWLNEHGSGVGGRPIELVECETMGDPGQGADCGNQMVEEDVVAVVLAETAVTESVWEPLHQAKVPVMTYGTGSSALLADSEATFALGDPLFSRSYLPLELAKENGADKVTVVVIDVPAALDGTKTMGPLFEEAGVGLEIVPVPPGTADMTPQMQRVAADAPGVVQIIGNDVFCISALNGLRAFGYEGQITTNAQCVTDATREAVPGDMLEGIVVSASTPVGTDNPSIRLYEAVMNTFGEDVDTTNPGGVSMFIALAGFHAAVEGISGDDLASESVVAAIKAMPEKELPGAGGMQFRCNGKASPTAPAVCVRGGLIATLDTEGQPTDYEVIGSSPIED